MSDVSLAIELLGYPSTDLSVQQAKNVLNVLTNDGALKVDKELLRELVNLVLADAPGDLTVLYGAEIQGEGAGSVVRNLAANNPNLRIIGNTPAAEFLTSDEFEKAVAKTFSVEVEDLAKRTNAGNAFLEATDGLWGDVSENFIAKTTGDITGIIGEGADPTRIFAMREITRMMETPSIKNAFGLNLDALRKSNLSTLELFELFKHMSNVHISASGLSVTLRANAFKNRGLLVGRLHPILL